MNTKEPPTERSQRIRQAMHKHVADRLAKALDKWKGKDDAASRLGIATANEKFQLARILEKGERANGMAVATHIAKGIHPDLKIKNVSNLHVPFNALPSLQELGSHVLNSQLSLADTTGDGAYNAAAYELYLLLDCQVDGIRLGDLLQAKDVDAINALSFESSEPSALTDALLSLLDSKCARPAVHTLSKQIFWMEGNDPCVDSHYHLLAPLYPASLVHQAYLQIHPTRYGEANSNARKARRDGKHHDGVYEEYRDWATQKMGGTKPQNVSHLNSERRGDNYLLSSLPPPAWQASTRYLPTHTHSVFERTFGSRPAVRSAVKGLLAFLMTDAEANRHTRKTVDNALESLVDELVIYAGEMQSQLAGWSLDAAYEDLVLSEKLWLDPARAALPDEADFAAQWQAMDWPAEVAQRFARWLNAQLQGKLSVGDTETREWQRVLLADDAWMFAGGAA